MLPTLSLNSSVQCNAVDIKRNVLHIQLQVKFPVCSNKIDALEFFFGCNVPFYYVCDQRIMNVIEYSRSHYGNNLPCD